MKYSIFHFFKKNRLIILLSVIACIFYFSILYRLGSFNFVKDSLYSTSDSLEYKGYTEWLTGKIDYCNPFRTFFYPLIILISDKLIGEYGIWFFQFLFWLIGSILIFKTAFRLSEKKWLATLSFVLATSNVSLIVYTAHALTEVATFFFLSLFIYFLSNIYKDHKKIVYYLGLLFIISALATIKPLFQFVWYAGLVTFIIINYRSVIRKPLLILLIILASSPVIIQETIYKIEYDSFSSTKIADYNMRFYFYRKVNYYQTADNKPEYDELPEHIHDSLRNEASKIDKNDIIKYLFTHPGSMIKVYWNNIDQNFSSGNPYIDNKVNKPLSKWTANINNNIVRYVHLLMPLFWIFYLLKRFRKRNREYYFIFASGLTTFYILYSCGITYWAGDRLVVSSVALWSLLYPLLVYQLFIKKTDSENIELKISNEINILQNH